MDMGARSTDQWREHRALLEAIARNKGEGTTLPVPVPDPVVEAEEEADPPTVASPWRETAGAVVLGVVAVLWVAAVFTSFEADGGALVDVVARVSMASGPLALLGILYLLLRRTSRREARRFAHTASAMRAEANALEQAVARLAHRLDDNSKLLAEQSDRLLRAGEDSALRMAELSAGMRTGTETLGRQADRLEHAAATAKTDIRTLIEDLPAAETRIEGIAARIHAVGQDTGQQAAMLDAALAGLAAQAHAAAGQADEAARRLAQRIQEVEEAGAVTETRIEEASGRMISAIDTAYNGATAAVEQTRKSIEAQGDSMLALIDQAAAIETRLSGAGDQARALEAAITEARARTDAVADEAGPRLVEALLRVRDTANQAAEHARETLGEVIPDAAASLGSASRDAIRQTIGNEVEARMAELSAAADRALEAARKAGGALDDQMRAIGEKAAAIEARHAETRALEATEDENLFAPRVALLIEALNSTAIDVAKILSNDVTDRAWAKYLKGDRSVFTRRAVRLVNATEIKEIARHYDEDGEFREQVNRYIHDFEAMLRRALASRDGTPLSVTLLSSDAGKLYVALAQAIERLRT